MNKKLFTPIILCALFILTCFCFTACGNRNTGNNADETPNVNNGTDTIMDEGNTTTDNGYNNGVGDTANVGESLIEGAEDVVEDITNIDFTDYKSSHDYLLDRLGGNEGNKNNRYEVREESKDPVSYDPSDSSKKAYRYEVYDTTSDSDDKYGVFYVDHETGTIYRENDETDKVEEYKGY